jgi:hypothetical protein
VFPGEYLESPVQFVIDEARAGSRRAQTARKLLSVASTVNEQNQKARKTSNAVFDTIRWLERAHIRFEIKRARPDALTVIAAIVGERIEIAISLKMTTSRYLDFGVTKVSRAGASCCYRS